MKTFYYFLIVIFIVIVAVIPFALDQSINNTLCISNGIVEAICSLITLIIALILFDRHGLKKSMIEKRTEATLELLERIRHIKFFMKGEDSFIQYRPLKQWQADYEKFNEMLLVFDKSYLEFLIGYLKESKSLYLPTRIAEKLRKVEPTTISYNIEAYQPGKYLEVRIPGFPKEGERFGKFNNSDLNFYDFNNLWIDMVDELETWLKSNNIQFEDLNVEIN